MDGVRELQRAQLNAPVHLISGDSIIVTYEEPGKPSLVLVEETVTRSYEFTEAVIFEADAGIFGAGRALGGALIEAADA